ncbi:MAG: DNA cytosine methyltransferase [Ardenticatenales bacterium]|nr:DNA cytosine methyltransferase [Ardenticatenales bacterium]
MNSNNKPTLISLFAGAGGLDIGLELAGFVSLAVNELESHTCQTLKQNKVLNSISPSEFDAWFKQNVVSQRCYTRGTSANTIELTRRRLYQSSGQHSYLDRAAIIEGDIRNITSQQLMEAAGTKKGEVTLVAGGPPCQPFSRAGKRATVETSDGKLFLEFVRMVNEIKPRWFLFENVKGLAQSKTTVFYYLCTNCNTKFIVPFNERENIIEGGSLTSICPKCASTSCDTQTKEIRGGSLNIILEEFHRIGYQCYHTVLNSVDYGVPQNRERLFIVGSRDNETFLWPAQTHQEYTTIPIVNQYSLLELETKKQCWRTVKDVLWQEGHPQFGSIDYSKAVLWVKNVVRPHDEPVTWSLNRPSPTVGAHQGAKLAMAPYGVPEEQLARQQWHVLGRRQRDLPPVDVEHAMLSDEDLLRLQTIPPGWYLHGTRMERAFQIGNAVPPIFAKAIGQAILNASGLLEVQLSKLHKVNGI